MPDLELRGVANAEELHLAHDLMAKVHVPRYHEGMHWLETSGSGYPGYLREHTRVAFLDGELAGALRLTTDTIRIGEARLKMGGFGWVTTAPRYRHKGIACEMMRDTMRYMQHQQYHVSMLFGIPNFYHRFGFTTSIALHYTSIDTLEALTATHPQYRLREGKPGDIPALQKIHNAHDAAVACSVVRSRAHITNRWEQFRPVTVLTDDKGKVMAYFLPRPANDALGIHEIGVVDRRACGALLHACARQAQEEFLRKITFHAPPCHPFIQYLLQYKSNHEMAVQRDEGGMLAFVNLEETLESMIPEWESALMLSAAKDYRTQVTLVLDRKFYCIRANKGAIDISANSGSNKVSLSIAELMHLMTGYRYLEEILSSQRRIIAPDARALLNALFPKRAVYVWGPDRF